MQAYFFGLSKILLGVGLLAAIPFAQAGPPLATDDTGVLTPGGWEFIVATAVDSRDEGKGYVLPGVEANYGLTANTQITAGLARIKIDEAGGPHRSDFGALALEYKWRFFQGEHTAVAVVPAYALPLTSSSTDRGVIEDLRVLSLPIVASYATGSWEFNAQYSYDITSTGPNGSFFGLSAAYGLTDSVSLLGEVYGIKVSDHRADETNWTVGLDWGVSDRLAVLLSYGGGLSSDLAKVSELDYTAFLGLRYETG